MLQSWVALYSSLGQTVSYKCCLIANIIFWIGSLLGFFADFLVATQGSPLLARCKLQPHLTISGKEKRDLILLTCFNMTFMTFCVCCPLYEHIWSSLYEQSDNHNNRQTEKDVWNWRQEFFFKFPLHALATECGFYSTHYLFHHSPWLYKHIHKVHHRFQAPTAMTCVYAHPVEFAISNLLPIFLGPILTNAHPWSCYIWFAMAMFGTLKGHSGYRILGHSDYHEEHHSFYKYNYGGMKFLDYTLGTMAPSKDAKRKKNMKIKASE
mmetsp:Transcript_10494/g.16082  ORF Transcript_10494/g.16082 Transcript_10494/m.16082 type:complete len:266 (-) Transcript_10494:229-1026(-)